MNLARYSWQLCDLTKLKFNERQQLVVILTRNVLWTQCIQAELTALHRLQTPFALLVSTEQLWIRFTQPFILNSVGTLKWSNGIIFCHLFMWLNHNGDRHRLFSCTYRFIDRFLFDMEHYLINLCTKSKKKLAKHKT